MVDAYAYGKALYELSAENQNEAQVYEQLGMIRKVIKQNPQYITLMDTPSISDEEKNRMLAEAFGAIDPMAFNFLCLLSAQRSFYQLRICIKAFNTAYDKAHNILRATAYTAVPMKQEQADALTAKLQKLTGKNVVLKQKIDPALLGGIKLRYGEVQMEDSIRSRLDALSRSLSDTII